MVHTQFEDWFDRSVQGWKEVKVQIKYGGNSNSTAYDQFVVDKNTKVERGLLHLELFTRSSNKWHQNKDGTDDDP